MFLILVDLVFETDALQNTFFEAVFEGVTVSLKKKKL
jgi:hypothetical protein